MDKRALSLCGLDGLISHLDVVRSVMMASVVKVSSSSGGWVLERAWCETGHMRKVGGGRVIGNSERSSGGILKLKT